MDYAVTLPVRKLARQVDELAELFKNLADPTRLRILTALVERGTLCVHDLCDRLGMSQTAVSHSLRVLRTARLVRSVRRGREMVYSLDDQHVLSVLSEGLKHVEHGEGR
jgi:ArsR family transcriptional regulator